MDAQLANSELLKKLQDQMFSLETRIQTTITSVITLRQLKWEIPKSVTVLECPNKTTVYLIGTSHISKQSIEDVRHVIKSTHPDFVVIEQCKYRSGELFLSDNQIIQQMKEASLWTFITQVGFFEGIKLYLLQRETQEAIKTHKLIPGGEFRAAAQLAFQQPHCHLILGDRPIFTTFWRTAQALGIWGKIKMLFDMVFRKQSLNIINLDGSHNVEELDLKSTMENLNKEHPQMYRVLVDERDMYLTKSIWQATGMQYFSNVPGSPTLQSSELNDNELMLPKRAALDVPDENHSPFSVALPKEAPSCCPFWPSPSLVPRVVVAVVGIGHVEGIKRYWDHADKIDRNDLISGPVEVAPSSKYITWGLRLLLVSIVVGIGYKIGRASCGKLSVVKLPDAHMT